MGRTHDLLGFLTQRSRVSDRMTGNPSVIGLGKSGRQFESQIPKVYLTGREPLMRISTSRLALCCQSGLADM
jgi:hypothetical protein